MNKTTWILTLIVPIFVFVILSWKNPYAGKSLIGNFDPFPDSMHYIVPARNVVQGHGFRLWRADGEAKLAVPPLYSLSLIPGYLLNQDARTYYYPNLLLGIISIILLFFISKQLNGSPWITGMILAFYAGTYVIYWQTSLAMAENVLLPVLLVSIWLWIQPISITNTILTSMFAVFCYGSKYVSIPITLSILGLMFFKIFLSKKKKAIHVVFLFITALLLMISMNGSQLIENISRLYATTSGSETSQPSLTWASPQFIKTSFPSYFGALMGWPIYNLWSIRPILPPLIAAFVLIWCIFAVIKLPKYRSISAYVIVLTLSQLSLLSLINMVEGRYAFVFIPLIYTGFAAMIGWLLPTVKKQLIFVAIALLLLFIESYKDWKLQLLLNFKGSEVPWWQVGMVKTDEWMNEIQSTQRASILLSTMNPYMWDFYRHGDYQVLPYLQSQDFTKNSIWDVNPVPNDWRTYIDNQVSIGKEIYISTVGFNQDQWNDFEQFQKQYSTTLIKQDCNNSCRLYKIDNRQNNP